MAKRIESALTKQQIMSLYLNEIALGRQAFGVEAAAQAYFAKSVDQLQLHEMAFLAILPKAPERYGRAKNAQLAIARRNWVLGEMRKNELIIAYHVKATGQIRLSEELVDFRLVAPAKLRPPRVGTGFAMADWMRSQGLEPEFLEWPPLPAATAQI